jgi:hypothetical protein
MKEFCLNKLTVATESGTAGNPHQSYGINVYLL